MKKVILGIIAIILVAGCFVGGLFVGKEILKSDSKCENKVSEKQDLNDKEVQKEIEKLFSDLGLNIEHFPEYIALFYDKVGIGDFTNEEINNHGLDFMYLMYYQDHAQELNTIKKYDRDVKEISIADFKTKYEDVFGEMNGMTLTDLTEEKFNNDQMIVVSFGDEVNDSEKIKSCFLNSGEGCSLIIDSPYKENYKVEISYLKNTYNGSTNSHYVGCKAVIKDGNYNKDLSFEISYTNNDNDKYILQSVTINSISDIYTNK